MRSAFLAPLVLRISQPDNTLLQPYLMDAPLMLDLVNQGWVSVKCRVTGVHPFHRNIRGYTEIALKSGSLMEVVRRTRERRKGRDWINKEYTLACLSHNRSKSCALWND